MPSPPICSRSSITAWPKYEKSFRIEATTRKLLALLDSKKIQATFFMLGWTAERFPRLVAEIAGAGHEIGTHGYSHRLVYTQRPEEFAQELRKSIDLLEKITGKEVIGHIAASFSLTDKSRWAFKILRENGIKYDCSLFPIRHPDYGVPDAPRFPFVMDGRDQGEGLVEFPCSTVSLLGLNLPFSGGGYFRLLPYWLIKRFITHLNAKGQPMIIYLHPWEIDYHQPRQQTSWLKRFRHYVNLDKTEKKLTALLNDFNFAPAQEVLSTLDLL